MKSDIMKETGVQRGQLESDINSVRTPDQSPIAEYYHQQLTR